MWFSDMFCYLHVWYLHLKCCTFYPNPMAKVSCLTEFYIKALFLYIFFFIDYHTNITHSFIIKYLRELMSICIMTIIQALQWWLSHDIKHNANSVDGCVIKVKFILISVPIFSFDRYVSSVGHQNNDVSCGSWYYDKKDITALKAIWLPSEFQCLLWHLWDFHPTNKVHNQQRRDMGRGGHVLAVLDWYVCYGISI